MVIRNMGTRFTTGCGHSWKRRVSRWTVRDLSHSTSDCAVCGELVMIPGEQFDGLHRDVYPINVHMPLFHKYMHQQDPGWPENGANTGYVEF